MIDPTIVVGKREDDLADRRNACAPVPTPLRSLFGQLASRTLITYDRIAFLRDLPDALPRFSCTMDAST